MEKEAEPTMVLILFLFITYGGVPLEALLLGPAYKHKEVVLISSIFSLLKVFKYFTRNENYKLGALAQ